MSREIKFRAWDSVMQEMNGWDCILNDLVGNYEDVFNDELYDMMQFTGLKDKNGVDIYEGDILYYHHANHITEDPIFQEGVVYRCEQGTYELYIYKKYHHNWMWKGQDKVFTQLDGTMLRTVYVPSPKSREVIGNVYDNAELYEGCGDVMSDYRKLSGYLNTY